MSILWETQAQPQEGSCLWGRGYPRRACIPRDAHPGPDILWSPAPSRLWASKRCKPQAGPGSRGWAEHGDTLPGSTPGEGPQSQAEPGVPPKQWTTGLVSGLRPTHSGEGRSARLWHPEWAQEGRGTRELGVGLHTPAGAGRSPPAFEHICHQQWAVSTQPVTGPA